MSGSPLQLENFLPYRLARAAEEVSLQFAVLYRGRYGISRAEWRCLATIGQFGRITATDIGAHSSMHKSKVSRAVSELDQRKWVRRELHDVDRRLEFLSLTGQGERIHADLVNIALEFERDLIARLGKPQSVGLIQGLDAVEALSSYP